MNPTTIQRMISLQEQLDAKHQAIRAAGTVDDKLQLTLEADDLMRRMNEVRLTLYAQDQAEVERLEKERSQGKY